MAGGGRGAGRAYNGISVRLSADDLDWLRAEAKRLRLSLSAVLREYLDVGRRRYGLPPGLWREVEGALEQEGMSLPEYVSELLRLEATRLQAARRAAGVVGAERRRGIGAGHRA